MCRIVQWNIRQGGGKRVAGILREIDRLSPDVAVLTEFRTGQTGGHIRSGLAELGLSHCLGPEADPRVNSVLLASRDPVHPLPGPPLPIEDAHRGVFAVWKSVKLAGLYFPLGMEKARLLNGS